MYVNKEDKNAYYRAYRRRKRLADPAFVERERAAARRADEKRRFDPVRKAKKAEYERMRYDNPVYKAAKKRYNKLRSMGLLQK